MRRSIIIGFILLLFLTFANKASAAIIYHDTFNSTNGITLDSYNSSYNKYNGSDYIYLTGGNSIYSPIYGLEYYSGSYTSTQGLQFDFTTNLAVPGEKQQFGVEVFAHAAGDRSEDIYLEVYPDGSARILNIDATHIVNFPAAYFKNNKTYTLFISYDGNQAVIYLNGSQIDSFNNNYSGFVSGSFAVQLANYACIGNFYYTNSLTPLSSGAPGYLNCPTPINAISLDVPVLKQTSNPWQSQTYDGANYWSPSATTIKSWGCALTSYAMILKYFGINKLPNNANLDPGTLNTWLKNNKGYIDGKTSGYVNPLAITSLSKKAKQINNITSFDALEYTRYSGANTQRLTSDLNNNIPDVLEEPGHFVVAKGISGNTFTINDPYYSNRNDLNSYNNTFVSLNELTPSFTDLSYILIAGNQDLVFDLKDSSGQSVGDQFLQQQLIDDSTNQTGGIPIKMYLVSKPLSDNYMLSMSGNDGKKDIQIYFYDKDGNVELTKAKTIIKQGGSQDFLISFDSSSIKKSDVKQKKCTEDSEGKDKIKTDKNKFCWWDKIDSED